jgi:hypothetical protein
MLIAYDARFEKEVLPGIFVFQEDGGTKSLEDGLYWPQYVNIKEIEDGQQVSRMYELQGRMRWVPGSIPNQPHGQLGEYRIHQVWYILIKEDHYENKKWSYSCEPTAREAEKMKKGYFKSSDMERYITRKAEVNNA